MLAAVIALTLAGCGAIGEQKVQIGPGNSKPQNLSLMLDSLPNADHVGIYEAIANGDFKQASINVHVETPSTPAEPLQRAQAGKVDVAISSEPGVMMNRDHIGGTMLSFGSIVNRPLTSIISVGSQHIKTVAQLRGKIVGTAGIPYQTDFLNTILQRTGVSPSSVKQVNVGSDPIPAMLSGKVDATIGGPWNYEAIELRQAHKKPHVIQDSAGGRPDLRRARAHLQRALFREPRDAAARVRAGACPGL